MNIQRLTTLVTDTSFCQMFRAVEWMASSTTGWASRATDRLREVIGIGKCQVDIPYGQHLDRGAV